MVLSLFTPATIVKADDTGVFQDAPKFQKETFVAKPLVVLMDFQDYKHEDLDTKEEWRINKFRGKDTTPKFYDEMFFGDDTYEAEDGNRYITFNKYYKEISGGSYSPKGNVVGWYTAKHDAKYYGNDNNENGSDQDEALELVKEAAEAVAKDPKINLADYDVEDKWDKDKDGNYLEPDGIIDCLIIIHPGLGEEWGGGSLGKAAIWPFRRGCSWYNETNLKSYEVVDHEGKKWLAEDFTVFEQDLPLDLLCHEYGHVLGLPDLYGFGGSNPPVENWSNMGGSYAGKSIRGSMPNGVGAYCSQLFQQIFENKNMPANWQKGKTIKLEDIDENGIDILLDQASLKGYNEDVLRINLPQKITKITTPYSGKYAYFSGNDNNQLNFMSVNLDLTNKKDANLAFKTWYDIDPGFDFMSVQVNEEDTEEWETIKGNLTTSEVDEWVKNNETKEEIKGRNPGYGITADSGDKWIDAQFDLKDFVGKKIQLRFRWKTDGNTPGEGIYIDDIKVTADEQTILNDDADKELKFTLNGFVKSDACQYSEHYYLVEWRNNTNAEVDQGLKYINLGRPNLEYDPGLLIWYINTKWTDSYNKPDQYVNDHPGECFAGIVDADQNAVTYKYDNGKHGADSPNYQMHDAAFSLRKGSKIHIEGGEGEKHYVVEDNNNYMNPLFDDSKDYTNPAKTTCGLKLENYGLKIFVTDENADRSTVRIHIAKATNKTDNPAIQNAKFIKNIEIKDSKLLVKTQQEYDSTAYANYIINTDNGIKKHTIELKLNNGIYESPLNFANETPGLYQLNYIIFEDKTGNAKAIYNSKVNKVFGTDLSCGTISTVK